jgi:hypothetical protein
MKSFNTFLLMAFFLILGYSSDAQIQVKQDSTYIFEMEDGNTYIGKVVNLTQGEMYEVKTSVGNIKLFQKNIIVIKRLDKSNLKDGEYWPSSPHSSRYFFSPSGYGLRKGEGYYQNAWVFFNQVSYGISDNFSLGVGMIPTFLFGLGSEVLPIWFTPKVNIPYKNGKGAFGAGTLFITSLGEETGGVGLLYGSNTFGTRDKQFTLGVGLGYSGGDGFSEYPVINASGLIRTSKNWAFVTENYFFTFDSFGALISGGARYMGKRIAIDFGGFVPIFEDQDQFFIAPWLSISVPFGKRY